MKTPSRRFITVDYNDTLNSTITLRACLSPEHLARFLVDTIAQIDMSPFYNHYSTLGGKLYAPQILLSLLLYGYMNETFSSRKIEKATYESIPFIYIAGGLHPDHDTISTFRKTFLSEFRQVFVQILVLAQESGFLKMGDISLDGTKVHADASKSKAISYKHLLKSKKRLEQEIDELLALSDFAKEDEDDVWPEGFVLEDELSLRLERLEKLNQAESVLEQRAEQRYEAELAEYEEKIQKRLEKEQKTGKKSRGQPPKAPIPGPNDKDQHNFTDPDSRIMKNGTNKGFDQHYNAQIAVEHESRLIVAAGLSNHPNDKKEAKPTLEAIPNELGRPNSVSMDNGYYSENNVEHCEEMGIEAYIATGREPHYKSWISFFEKGEAPKENASSLVKMAYKLKTTIGEAIYRLRKCTVEPVIGIVKEVMGFRQFSLRGLEAAEGEWYLVCLAYNIKRMKTLVNT